MPNAQRCTRCGAALASFGADALCPKCMVAEAVALGAAELVPAASDSDLHFSPLTSRLSSPLRYFGDYELLEEIAHGGMGVVWKARQTSLNRIVAVKMILAGPFAGREYIARFRTEAEAAAKLQHPNIVAIHEVGEHEGHHYFSMDYVEGQNLAQLVRDQPLPAARAAAYVKIIAEAIHYAHERGVLHRDLKPSNVLIDRFDQPRVTDFGLAKLLRVESEFRVESQTTQGATPSLSSQLKPLSTDLTVSGQILGTPNYMPPEQAGGKRADIGPPSDVYSLGAILYHLLTARPPFFAEALQDTLHQVLHAEVVSPRLLNASIPRDLETVCLKCLNKDPHRRYNTAQDLADELGRFLRGEPIHSRPVGQGEKIWRWCRRNPVVTSLTAVSLLLLLALAIGSPMAAYRIRQQLWHSYLDQARANRWSGRAGRRFDSLEALRKAAEIRFSPELRNEAIACLALVDLRQELVRTNYSWFDATYERYARIDGGKITLFRRVDDRELAIFDTGEPPIHEIWFSPDGRYLATRHGKEGLVKIWDLLRGPELPEFSKALCWCISFSPDSRLLAVALTNKTISIYEVGSWREIRKFPYPPRPSTMEFHPKGGRIAISSVESTVVSIRDLNTDEVQSLPHPEGVRTGVWHPDGNLLAAGCMDGQVYVWDVVARKIRTVLSGHEKSVTGAYFNHRGDLLVSSGWDGMVRLWDPFAGRALLALQMNWVSEFSRDDRWLAGVIGARSSPLFEVVGGAECRILHSQPEPTDRPYCWDFSPDGELLASPHSDGVRLWNVREGKPIALFGEKLTRALLSIRTVKAW